MLIANRFDYLYIYKLLDIFAARFILLYCKKTVLKNLK